MKSLGFGLLVFGALGILVSALASLKTPGPSHGLGLDVYLYPLMRIAWIGGAFFMLCGLAALFAETRKPR